MKQYLDKFASLKSPAVIGMYERCIFYTIDDKFVEDANKRLNEDKITPFSNYYMEDLSLSKVLRNKVFENFSLFDAELVSKHYKIPKEYKVNDSVEGIDNYFEVANIISTMFLNIEKDIEFFGSQRDFYFFSGMYAKKSIFRGCQGLIDRFNVDPEKITVFASQEGLDECEGKDYEFNILKGSRSDLSKVVNQFLPDNTFMEVEGNYWCFYGIMENHGYNF